MDDTATSTTTNITLDTEERRSSEARSTYLTDYELNSNSSDSYLQHNRLAALKITPPPSGNDVKSEDELSGVSSHSPHRPRHQGGRRNTTGTTTPSSTTSASSRGHSPRTVSGVTGLASLEVTAKKKIARSARTSANLTQSTLQEDLMKLISPDYEQSENNNLAQESPLSKLPKKTLSELSLMKSRSRENIARLEDNVSAEVSFHMARPATVISNNSTTSSPASANTSGLSQSEKSINSNNSAPQNKNKIP